MADQELSPSEAAQRIGATTRSVQRWIAQGRLPARRVGGRWRVAFDALDAFVATTSGPEAAGLQPGRTDGLGPGGWAPAPVRHCFVANRGEIARRIRRTCDALGVRATVPPTDGPNALDLLDIRAVVAAAVAAGADGVHPGFGFLAENADFATAVVDAGMRWVGPPPRAIRAMGDKAAARQLAERLGVPTVPGYDGPTQTDSALVRAAGRIGYPLLVKPAAGGGGKGMRVVRDRASLRDALAAARREATSAFGDDRLILERLVEGPRHVEVQVLFDAHGAGIHLGERDCSVQRRHQKVLEETPSPGIDAATRAALTSAAVRLAAAVGYVGAGTCEFLVDDRGGWYFLEMNTRLQVEHPVTELVTGRDLVADQLRIAAGEPLGVSQDAADAARTAGGHAVEVRLYAEDAEDGFLPATGRIERLGWPRGAGVRIDAGIDEGDAITGRFDPMLAKIVTHGADRGEALGRLRDALDATVVLGVITNLRFLRWLVREPFVVAGEARIDSLDRFWPPDDWPDRSAIPDAAWTEAARALAAGDGGVAQDQRLADATSAGWRLNAPSRLRLACEDGSERTVDVPTAPVGVGPLVRVGPVVHVDVAGRSVAFRLAPPPDVDRAARAAGTGHAGGPAVVAAPMPGAIIAVHAARGATVAAGDPLVTLEAMKMEHVVRAPIAGTVSELPGRPADQVVRGQTVAVIAPA